MLPVPHPAGDAVLAPAAVRAVVAGMEGLASKGLRCYRRSSALVDDRERRRALIHHDELGIGRQGDHENGEHGYLAEGVLARSATALFGHISNRMPSPLKPQFFHEFIIIGDHRPSIFTAQIMHIEWENRL